MNPLRDGERIKRDEFELELKWKRAKKTADHANDGDDEPLPTEAVHYPDV